nr:unnamed protein product [Digitaria exilis]
MQPSSSVYGLPSASPNIAVLHPERSLAFHRAVVLPIPPHYHPMCLPSFAFQQSLSQSDPLPPPRRHPCSGGCRVRGSHSEMPLLQLCGRKKGGCSGDFGCGAPHENRRQHRHRRFCSASAPASTSGPPKPWRIALPGRRPRHRRDASQSPVLSALAGNNAPVSFLDHRSARRSSASIPSSASRRSLSSPNPPPP